MPRCRPPAASRSSACPPPRRAAWRSPRRASPTAPDGREPDGWALRRVLDRVGLIQIDSVNVLQRAHYLPLFSRLGPYDTELLDRAAHRAPRKLFEYWGHEASLLPVATQPLLRWRMERAADDAWGGMRRIQRERPELVARVLDEVRDRGPIAASEVAEDEPRSAPARGGTGRTSSARSSGCSGAGRSRPRGGAGSSGCTTSPSACSRPRSSPRRRRRSRTPSASWCGSRRARWASRPRRTCATTSGCRSPRPASASRSWSRPASCGRSRSRAGPCPATCTRTRGCRARVHARALVGPFDSLVWERPRVERIFGFRYRIEIYVPAPKRVHGYYVLPFLLGDRLVARVDLKADRAAGVLRVQAAHAEPDAPPETAAELRRGARADGRLARARRRRGPAARRPRRPAGRRRLTLGEQDDQDDDGDDERDDRDRAGVHGPPMGSVEPGTREKFAPGVAFPSPEPARFSPWARRAARRRGPPGPCAARGRRRRRPGRGRPS